MEDDGGVKAPVTRLRRRLSVEQSEESKSPAVNTPTKKRGGRKAKPDLELIDENTPENTKNVRTKKTAVKEVTDTVEEKGITPSRRNARIKSNTSIISETAVAVGSPRAKRAARRASQVGSDSEAPSTPIRQTRRTRKDSTSSVEIAETQPVSKQVLQITDVIVEEPENNGHISTNNSEKDDNLSPSTRKSPRLANKSKQNQLDQPTQVTKEESENKTPKNNKSNKSVDLSISNSQETEENSESQVSRKDKTESNELSLPSINLTKQVEVVVTKLKFDNLNKSTSDIEKFDKTNEQENNKSDISLPVSMESSFDSDDVTTKKKIKKKVKNPIPLIKSDTEDASTSMQDKSDKSLSVDNKSKIEVDSTEISLNKSKNKSKIEKNIINSNSDLTSKKSSNVSELFEKEPSLNIQTRIYIEEDSDSNSGKNTQNIHENEDQCVPVVKQPVQTEKDSPFNVITEKEESIIHQCNEKSLINDSCEPMDIDETIPENHILEMESNEINSSKRKSISKCSLPENEKLNKSERKSSISCKDLEKSNIENKSTLISQPNDTSSKDVSGEAKSHSLLFIKNDTITKTADILNITQENEINKRNLSLTNVTTSTPLQQKNLQKLAVQVNTSLISANDSSKDLNKEKNVSQIESTCERVNNYKEDSSNKSDSIEKDCDKVKQNSKQYGNKNKSKAKDSDNNESEKVDVIDDKLPNKKNNSVNSSKQNLTPNSKVFDEDSESDKESLDIIRKPINTKGSKASKKNISITTNETNSEAEMESNGESRETSHLLDDEADDAGDDYESGDSQDEEEREYERQNKILEKGETLTSEEDLSDDSDYEKDSFVVSSAEEDNDLLDGSEDDLSMTDNELKITAKSKKKFNERKMKEQRKASKEMYEARHKLNTSSSDVKSKKNRRQQLASSESDEEFEPQSRNKNRMRLDSTNEGSMLEDISEKVMFKKKTKRLSESFCNESNTNEKEITISNVSFKENDPLSTQIKIEPKTPQKCNSSITFINPDNINKDDNNKSELTKTQTEILDPLDSSVDDDDSLNSDSGNIIHNYDSILEGLNKSNKGKLKTCDISLNLDKKVKKQKVSLVDELNLTQVKPPKKNKKKQTKEAEDDDDDISFNTESQDDAVSSDSIDLHLLFSEDSNNSEDVLSIKKNNNVEEFIPLIRKDAKTDIQEDKDTTKIQANNTSLNNSHKKNKKRKSKIEENVEPIETEENDVCFFIDTEGTHTSINKSDNSILDNKKKLSMQNNDNFNSSDSDDPLPKDESLNSVALAKDETDFSTNKSINTSITKKPDKVKKMSIIEIEELPVDNNSDSDPPAEVSYKTEKRTSNVENMVTAGEDVTDCVTDKSIDKSTAITPVSEKKKKKKVKDTQVELEENENPTNSLLNTSLSSAKKKKNKAIHASSATDHENAANESLNISLSKKKKKKSVSTILESEKSVENDSNTDKSLINNGKNTINEIQKTKSGETDDLKEDTINISKTKTPSSQKKKKLTTLSQNEQNESLLNKPRTPVSQEKPIDDEHSENKDTNSKKRKRKASLNVTVEATEGDGAKNTSKDMNESLVGSQEKKRKISQQNDNTPVVVEQTQEDDVQYSANKTGKKSKILSQCSNQEVPAENTKTNRNKRKIREDDEDNTKRKVFKENSYDKLVPRLPASILNQLEDNPQKVVAKEAKVISTTQFLVEESKKRKNKPSNFLEESVYLNDEESETRTQKKRLFKPKVLPFVPTAITSGAGYTTNFKVNVIPKEIKFIAQSNNISNYKKDYLYNKQIKRQGTYELYKRNRNIKLSKF